MNPIDQGQFAVLFHPFHRPCGFFGSEYYEKTEKQKDRKTVLPVCQKRIPRRGSSWDVVLLALSGGLATGAVRGRGEAERAARLAGGALFGARASCPSRTTGSWPHLRRWSEYRHQDYNEEPAP